MLQLLRGKGKGSPEEEGIGPMTKENWTRGADIRPGPGVETSLDELAKGLASGRVSRSKALRLMGGALVGAALASVPGVAWAAPGGNSACARFCTQNFPSGPERGECTSQGAQGGGQCYECTPGIGPGPNFVVPECPGGAEFNTEACQCEAPCPPCTPPMVPNPDNCQCECSPPGPSQCNNVVCAPGQVCINLQCVPPDPDRVCTAETFGPGCNGDETCFCGRDYANQPACYQTTCGETLACQPLQGCSSHSDCPPGTICSFLSTCAPACGGSCP
jgi:hypothetical protein